MTGSAIGLLGGLGLVLLINGRSPTARTPRRVRPLEQRAAELAARAGMPTLRARQVFLGCAVSGTVGLILAGAVSRAASIAIAFGGFAAYLPWALLRARARRRTVELRDQWPDVVDNLASAVRAGLSLPEAVIQVGVRGPAELREPFRRFSDDYRATGRFSDSLDRLKQSLADPVGDRVVESLRVAREVGGTDLGRLLRTLSQFLREDARTRAELEARQSWTVNAARLALAAPWVVLALLSLRPGTVAAYDTASGVLVLVIGAAVSFGAYRLMLRLARLPDDERVLQ